MKSRKLFIGFIGCSLLLVFLCYCKVITECKHSALMVKSIKHEFEVNSNMLLALQTNQMAMHELLERQQNRTIANENYNEYIETIQHNLNLFEKAILISVSATQADINFNSNIKSLKNLQEQLKLLQQINQKYLLYKNNTYEIIKFSKRNNLPYLNLLRNKAIAQYELELLPLLIKYKNSREELVDRSNEVIKIVETAEQQIMFLKAFIFITAIISIVLICRSRKRLNQVKPTRKIIELLKANKTNSKDELEIVADLNQTIDELNNTILVNYIERIINSMPEPMIVLSPDATISIINQAAIKLLGYTEKELIGLPFSKIIPLEVYKKILNNIFRANELNNLNEFIANTETTYLTKDTRQICVTFTASVMQDDRQQIQGIICVAHDITHRKEAEKLNTLLVTAVDRAADAIEITDARAKFEYVNPAFEKVTGYKSSEVIGKTPGNLLRSGKHDDAFYQNISNTLECGQSWTGNYIGKRKDGTLYHQEVTISPVSNAAGLITHHVAVKRDITDRKQMEERLTKINECFLSFSTDPLENINRLTALLGELLDATCTLYNRLEEQMLCSVGQWQTPPGYNPIHEPVGRICYDVIQQGSDEIFVLHDLANTNYAQTDPNVTAYKLQTYVGKAVKCRERVIGSLCAVYQTNYILTEVDRKVIGIIAGAIGVEEERSAMQESLRESEERYALAARAAKDGLWDWNLKTNKVYFSSRSKALLGCADEEIGDDWEEFFHRVHPQDVNSLKSAIATHLEGLTTHFESEYRVLHKDGKERWILCSGLAVRDANGLPYRMAGCQTDITQRKQTEAQLLHQAFHDALTKLPNRLLFMERLEYAIARAKRSEDYLFAVLFLDLDRFKVVNDSLGHNLGDLLLVAIAQRLKACVRPGDTISRLGGDEFTILLDEIKDVSEATQIADRIQKHLSMPFHLGGHEVCTSSSIGIAISNSAYEHPEDLLRDADATMYRAKALGKARFEVFDPSLHSQAMARLQLEIDLRRTLEQQELQVYYQPIISLNNGKITGFEALVRWQHPTRGFVSPAEFIPIAEETGLIIPLGWSVLRQACRQLRSWQQQFSFNPPLTISVNLSGKQLALPNLVKKIEQILHETEFDARYLKLEITESVLVENAASVTVTLQHLKALGIGLSIDDFGTGYSSLSYLHRLPIDTLKIDRSFVNNVDCDPEKIEIIRTVVALAWNLGMNIVAEGVETKKQMYQLQALKCEYGQGYLFSKPVDSKMAEALISERSQWMQDMKMVTK